MYVIPKVLLFLVLASIGVLLVLSMAQMVALNEGLRNFNFGIVNARTVTQGKVDGEGFGSFSFDAVENEERSDYETCRFEDEFWRGDGGKRQTAAQSVGSSAGQLQSVSGLCRSTGRALKALTDSRGVIGGHFLNVVLKQGLFILLAAMVVAIALSCTLALAIWLDWMQHSLGYDGVSRTILRVIDAIPYTVWLLLLIGFHLSLASFLAGVLHGFQWERNLTALLSQSVIYAGVYLLLMPLFLSLFVAAIRRARSDGIFDAFVMDGMYMREIYWQTIQHRLLAPAGKAFLFALAFVVMFDPLLQRITEGRLAVYAVELDGLVPEQVFLSPFYQWSRLKEHRILDGEEARKTDAELTKVSTDEQEGGAIAAGPIEASDGGQALGEYTLWREVESSVILPAVQTVILLPKFIRGAQPRAEKTAAVQAVRQMWVYPGSRLDVMLWHSIQRNPALCSQLKVCQMFKQNGRLPAFFIQGSIVQAFAKAYFFLNLAIILLLVGPLAALELQRFSSGRVERA